MADRDRRSPDRGSSFLPYSWAHGAGKWVTAGITTVAALLALMVNAQNLGLGAWLGAHGVGFADYAASRIVLTPRNDSLFAVGDTLIMAATVTDRHGASLAGPTVLWQTEDSSVATVDSSGAVVSRGPGATRVAARVRQVFGYARVVVRPRVVRVAIAGDSTVRLLEGGGAHLSAVSQDARGARVRDRVPAWSSSDTTVATVDATGVVTARAPGHATLTASAEGFSAQVTLEVSMAPGVVIAEAGDGQRGPAGRRLPQPLVVRVMSKSGRPVPDVTVRFRADDADASLDPASAVTDHAGRARSGWTLSARPGRQRLVASVENVDSVATFGAESDPQPRNTRVQASGGAAGSAGRVLDQPVTIRATDSAGAALADVPVMWTALDGGSVQAGAERTDSLGEARARWTLGPQAGEQRLRVQVGNPRTIPPVVVRAQAGAGAPTALKVMSGDGQRGEAGQALPHAVVVAATDSLGNPVPGVPVAGFATAGSVPDSVIVTDAAGRASVRWTLGHTAGDQRLTLRLSGNGAQVRVTARALALSAANIAFNSPPAAAVAGRPVPLAALVTDGYGNPVADAMVSFSADAGALSPGRVLSDAAGRARTRWTPAAPASGAAADVTVTAQVRRTALHASAKIRVSGGRRR